MYFTGTPEVALKTSLGCSPGASCCASCANHKGLGDVSVNVVGVAALLGVTWLVIKSMKRVAR